LPKSWPTWTTRTESFSKGFLSDHRSQQLTTATRTESLNSSRSARSIIPISGTKSKHENHTQNDHKKHNTPSFGSVERSSRIHNPGPKSLEMERKQARFDRGLERGNEDECLALMSAFSTAVKRPKKAFIGQHDIGHCELHRVSDSKQTCFTLTFELVTFHYQLHPV
jgi:hypothetical protein